MLSNKIDLQNKKVRLLKIISDVEMSHQLMALLIELDSKVSLRCIFIHTHPPEILLELRNRGLHCDLFKGGLFSIFLQLLKSMVFWRPSVVHAHLRRAKLTAIPASTILFIRKRIYTRHSSDYNHTYFPKSVKFDKLINSLSTNIVCISRLVENILREKENVPQQKLELIHHGFELDSFRGIEELRKENLRTKYNLPKDTIVVGVVARWLELKGIPYAISGFSLFLQNHPNAILVLANATGPYEREIIKALKILPPDSFRVVRFEMDMAALYNLMDYYIHIPISSTCEAFGQTYIESLASGTPLIATLSGVASEFLTDEKNALIVPYCDDEAVFNALMTLEGEHNLRSHIIKEGALDVEVFALNVQVEKLLNLYE